MPRYDYECETCHREFEIVQSFDSEPVATCPYCQNSARRMLHAVPIVFKGSGWYVNDHGKRGSVPAANSDKNESSESESKPVADTDSAKKGKSKSEAKSTSGSGKKSSGD